ncbi:hypothetical protein [Ancylomarina sp. 16SWW S1-10-2]|uniref:hypothetical protein n=1 Tax=Ancylomarina sp. 16SWW S1-10-2 TaxID=2499681 RepID=UPI0012AD8D0E|nr:hypothetical protein [Ancylomarina sp. 16SWW S1-10-2]MRT94405.1 hypothetical protein [Ancylomarina sp. 16SWW S1-10-2]
MSQTNELVDYYFKKKKSGMDFSEIRKELKGKGIGDNEVKEIIKAVDAKALVYAQTSGKMKPKDLRLIGYALMLVGGILTFAVYFKMLVMGKYVFAAYGPVIIGYILVVMARRQQNKQA